MSGLGHLCAAGVVFMVLVATARELRRRGYYTGGTCTPPDLLDSARSRGAGHRVRRGAAQGPQPRLRDQGPAGHAPAPQHRPQGARAMPPALAVAPTPYHLGFVLGPRINAGGRIGDAALGARLLSIDDEIEAARIAVLLDKLNRERKAIETQMLDEAMAHADQLVEADAEPAAADGRLRRVGTRASSGWWRAAWWSASAARPASSPGTARTKARARCARSPASTSARRCARRWPQAICKKGGGHAMAAGLTVARDRLEALRAFLRERAGEQDRCGARRPWRSRSTAR